MKIALLCVGKTEAGYLEEGLQLFMRRLKHYLPVECIIIAEHKTWKKLPIADRIVKEGEAIMEQLHMADHKYLLDESGTQYSSVGFASLLQREMNSGTKVCWFVVGGAYGFSDEVKRAVPQRISLSSMTFSHQMVRVFFAEQLYRAMTILRHEPYHNL